MARGFGSTFGNAATGEVIASNAPITLTTGFSFAAWIYVNAAGQGNNGLIFAFSTSTPLTAALRLNGSTTSWVIAAPWTTTRGGWSFTSPVGSGSWFHLAMTYSGSSTGNSPAVYVNGQSVSVATTATPAGTFGLSGATNLTIGNTLAVNWDGMIAEAGLWADAVLAASEVAALSKGVPPLFTRRAKLAVYLPLYGTVSGEPDWGPARATQTVTGTKKQNHAPVSFWMPPAPTFPVDKFTSSGALVEGADSFSSTAKEIFSLSGALHEAADSFSSGILKERFIASGSLSESPDIFASSVKQKFIASASFMEAADSFFASASSGDVGPSTFGGTVTVRDDALYKCELSIEPLH